MCKDLTRHSPQYIIHDPHDPHYIKICRPPLIIRKIPTLTTTKHHFLLTKMAAIKSIIRSQQNPSSQEVRPCLLKQNKTNKSIHTKDHSKVQNSQSKSRNSPNASRMAGYKMWCICTVEYHLATKQDKYVFIKMDQTESLC